MVHSRPTTIELHRGRVDLIRGVLHAEDEDVHLTPTERELLQFFVSRPSVDLPREALLFEVLGYQPSVKTRALDTAMKGLRAKVERDRKHPEHLFTVWGVGYRFEPLRTALPSAGLVGRRQELGWLEAALRKPEPVLITGPAGVGKSRLTEGIPTAVHVYLDGLGPDSSVKGCVSAALPAGDLPLVGQLAASTGVLVVHDAERSPAGVEGLAALCEQAEAKLVVTSRHELDGAWLQLDLSPLAPTLLRQVFEEALGPARSGWSDAQLKEVVEQLDGLPLAAELLGAWAAVLGPEEVGDQLADLLNRSHPFAGSMPALLARSLDTLPDPVRETFAACSMFRGPFRGEDLRAVVGE